jgi:hypothetical protein
VPVVREDHVKGRTTPHFACYYQDMETVVLVVLAVVVALVAIDAIGRLDERGDARQRAERRRDEASISTQKIIVDLSKRK